jgi:hypothetical protein
MICAVLLAVAFTNLESKDRQLSQPERSDSSEVRNQ